VLVQADDLSLKPEERNVASVGWRHGWWGSSGELARGAEAKMTRSENESAPILREVASRWPLCRDDRAAIAQFIAVHTVRTPAWRDAYNNVSMEAIGNELKRRRWDPEVEKAAVTGFMGTGCGSRR
jgi:hypothetical protein